MYNWQYRAYKADNNGKRISKVIEGEMKAANFVQLSLLLRQTGLFVIKAIKLNPDNSLATQRLARMKSRFSSEPIIEQRHMPMTSAIRRAISWFIPPFFRR